MRGRKGRNVLMIFIGNKLSRDPTLVLHLNFKCNEKENKAKLICKLVCNELAPSWYSIHIPIFLLNPYVKSSYACKRNATNLVEPHYINVKTHFHFLIDTPNM
jgi:hypothetical protein